MKSSMNKITYAITVCNELTELETLFQNIWTGVRKSDEIVIQGDLGNVRDDVKEYCRSIIANHKNILYTEFPLNNDFSAFKNNLFKFSTGDYIFQVDADEIPHENLIRNLPALLDEYSDMDLFLVPRINTVAGLTEDWIKKWNWRVNENGWVNYPDFQYRIYKNDYPRLHWVGKVHERIMGFSNYTSLPIEEQWSLYHPKKLDRQIKQNERYDKMV